MSGRSVTAGMLPYRPERLPLTPGCRSIKEPLMGAKTRHLPIFALNTVLLPGAPLPLHVFEQRYRRMVADVLEDPAREFVVLLIKDGDEVLERPPVEPAQQPD